MDYMDEFVRNYLTHSGWYPGRHSVCDDFIKAMSDLGFNISNAAKLFLTEFGKLTIKSTIFGQIPSKGCIFVNYLLEDKLLSNDLKTEFASDVFPIGFSEVPESIDGRLILMDETGRIVSVSDEFSRLGNNYLEFFDDYIKNKKQFSKYIE